MLSFEWKRKKSIFGFLVRFYWFSELMHTLRWLWFHILLTFKVIVFLWIHLSNLISVSILKYYSHWELLISCRLLFPIFMNDDNDNVNRHYRTKYFQRINKYSVNPRNVSNLNKNYDCLWQWSVTGQMNKEWDEINTLWIEKYRRQKISNSGVFLGCISITA